MKLDRTTVTGIEIDAARQAFVGTLVAFAEEHGCQVIAEGVETDAEPECARDAGVQPRSGLPARPPRCPWNAPRRTARAEHTDADRRLTARGRPLAGGEPASGHVGTDRFAVDDLVQVLAHADAASAHRTRSGSSPR